MKTIVTIILVIGINIALSQNSQEVKMSVRFELPKVEDVKWHLVNNPSKELNKFVKTNYLLYIDNKEVEPKEINISNIKLVFIKPKK